ncbi:MAG: LysR family transcriptional regulator, partial [Campylobacter sp.]|nr:LysR family transcriptional regulator [Campylobacter sp.]
MIKSRLWIEKDGKNFLGHGKVELLEKIKEHGSINAAAKAMKMSYKAAWDAV